MSAVTQTWQQARSAVLDVVARRPWPPPRPAVSDILFTAILSPFPLLTWAHVGSDTSLNLGVVLGLLAGGILFALFTLPLLWRRVYPVDCAAVLVAAHLGQVLLISAPTPANVTVPVMLFAVARWAADVRARRMFLLIGLAGALIGPADWLGGDVISNFGRFVNYVLLCASVVVVAWLLGSVVRHRALASAEGQERALAEQRERGQHVRIAASEERSRIAREMHDVVAHSLSVIVVQSDGAAYALEQAADRPADPALSEAALRSAAAALTTIGRTARASLADTRRLVSVLRDGTGPDYAPVAGVEALDELIHPLREAGRDIYVEVVGTPARALSTPADLAAYRVVQESLTNVIKHAGPLARAWVHLVHGADGLRISVRDDGLGGSGEGVGPGGTGGDGHGLLGMRERVGAVGGALRCGNAAGGGFLVEAFIPYDEGVDESVEKAGVIGDDETAGSGANAERTGTRDNLDKADDSDNPDNGENIGTGGGDAVHTRSGVHTDASVDAVDGDDPERNRG